MSPSEAWDELSRLWRKSRAGETKIGLGSVCERRQVFLLGNTIEPLRLRIRPGLLPSSIARALALFTRLASATPLYSTRTGTRRGRQPHWFKHQWFEPLHTGTRGAARTLFPGRSAIEPAPSALTVSASQEFVLGERYGRNRTKQAISAATIIMCIGSALWGQDYPAAPEPTPYPAKLEQEMALREIESSLDTFFRQHTKEPLRAFDELYKATRLAVKVWPPVEEPLLLQLAHAASLWFYRATSSSENRLATTQMMHEAATQSSATPGEKALLLRSIWHHSSRTSLRLAYDAADSLLRYGHADEAGRVVNSALSSVSPETSRSQIDQASYELLGILYLNVKLMNSEQRRTGGWTDLQAISALAESRRKSQGSRDSKYLAWQVLAADEMVAVATEACDPSRLELALDKAIKGEIELLTKLAFGMNENLLLRMFEEVSPAFEATAPLRNCSGLVNPIVEKILQRLLIRHEAWRFKRFVAAAASESEDPFLVSTRRSLASTRRLLSQIQLRKEDHLLESELKKIPFERNFSPPPEANEIHIAWFELSTAAAAMESVLTDAIIQEWAAETRKHATDLVARLRGSLAPTEAFLYLLDVATEGASSKKQILAFIVDRERPVAWRLLSADLNRTESAESDETESTVPAEVDGTAHQETPGKGRGQISIQSAALDTNPLRTAGRELIDPIEELLNGKTDLIVLVFGSLRQLQWAALIDQRNRFLGDRFGIRYVQSASDLDSSNPGAFEDAEILLVGPEYSKSRPQDLQVPLTSRKIEEQFGPLPGATLEIEEIEKVLRSAGIEFQTLSGEDAVERRVWDLKRPQAVHFAGHGFSILDEYFSFQVEQPFPERGFGWPFRLASNVGMSRYRAGIVLTDFNKGSKLPGPDGLLTAAEVVDLDLRGTRLVVLSACETAFPVDQHATGLFDLALAFRQAGARSVVASLWKVHDDATQLFMRSLYESLADGSSVVSATQKARIKVRSDSRFSDPYYWAGFEVFGENISLASEPTDRDVE